MSIRFNDNLKNITLRYYSLGMVVYALFCFVLASIKFFETGNKNVFLFHDLVSLDVNAIYIAGFASFCLFYFIKINAKKTIDFVAIYILFFFVLLLSSKTMLFVDFCLFVWYYLNHSKTGIGIKIVSVAMAFTFVLVSVVYIKNIRVRFLEEYETAFVDNSTNDLYGTPKNKVFNVSLKHAWVKKQFIPNDFMPGTAFRVFHVRLFKEIMHEKQIFYTGLGQDASEKAIKNKYQEYSVFTEFTYFNFHNQFVQIFAELGFFGFLIFMAMMVANFRNAYLNRDFLHTVFAFTTFALFLTESMLCRQRGIVFFITLYCIFNTLNQNTKKTITQRS